ncbi:MAG: hypothetical protein Q8Q48_00740 [Candidatus Staskawiczbacteria bacterium]|nr:hypothetical protein [Candidatus Staskawiczbacteria bacterium]
MKYSYSLFLLFSIILLCFASPAFAGLGISPSDWVEKNGLLGQQIEKTFTISRSDDEEDLYFTSEITGELTDWIRIENGNSFVMPKGQQQLPVNIILNIPETAEKKEYKGEIRLKSSSKAAQSGQVGVLLSALIRIDLTVSDKPFLSYDVLQIEIPTQETGNAVNVILKIWNKGNVLAKPTKLTADIFDKFNTTKIDSFTLTDFSAVTGVIPFSEGEIKLQIPIQLKPEQYWANISVYQDEKVLKSDDVTFDIVEAGMLKKESPASKIFNNNYLLIGIGILLAVVIIVGVVIGIWLFKRRGGTDKTKKDGGNKIEIKSVD